MKNWSGFGFQNLSFLASTLHRFSFLLKTTSLQVTLQRWSNTDQPNGSEELDSVCVSVNGLQSPEALTSGEWADVMCAFKNPFLCEKDE